MKTDSIFYQIFLNYPKSFFDLIRESSTDEDNYQFTSREVKQLSFRLDGLFLPTQETSEFPLYLVEVQFQPDEDLYYRLFAEFFLFLRQDKPPYPWQIVVIYPSRNIEREQSIHFGDFLNLSKVNRVYLDELGEAENASLGIGVINLVVQSKKQAVPQAKGLIQKAQSQLTDERLKQELIDLIEKIIVYKFPEKSREEIEAMFELSDLKQTKVYQEAFTEGEANLVLLQLKTRFPELSPSLAEQIRGLSIEQLENLGKALLGFESEDDLKQWLTQNR
ncbi:MAG: Rpn family recombination-promoting nuclease/putative transposase [Cyanobacteria bacterium P01_G01_bin.49]